MGVQSLGWIRILCAEDPVLLEQTDTFFHCPGGRLKIREFGKGSGELIYYNRKNISGPKLSEYLKYESSHPKELKIALTSAYGVLGVVQKKRVLFMVGQTRIHVDRVKYLGDFLELEVVLTPKQSITEGSKIADDLMIKLGINSNNLIESAYIDLLHE
jgi:predicted adenylyl cyclase CyaB